jgi:uncharacterized protein (TIGR04222 family)
MSRNEGNRDMEALWARLDAFELDARDAAAGFSARLARENGWSGAHTARVVREYKRFLALAVCAGHPVTPSVAVDQAWHLHLLYTRSYWDDLCGTVLGRPLHHEPTSGGPDEAAKFRAQYERTLSSYRRLFGTEPPTEIWPTTKARSRVRPRRWLPAALALLTALTLVGCRLNVFDYRGAEFLAFYVLGFAVSLVLSGVLVHLGRRGVTSTSNDLPTDPYDVAMLGGGEERMWHAALAALHARGRLDVDAPHYSPATVAAIDTGDAVDLPPAERALLRALPTVGRKPVRELKDAVRTTAGATHALLVRRGLLLTPARHAQLRWYAAAPLLAMIAVGCGKILVGLSRDRPVFYLVVLVILSGVALVARVKSVSGRTPVGEDAWRRLQSGRVSLGSGPAQPSHVAHAVALGGAAALAGLPAFGALQRAMNLGQGGGAGCGASDGGGGGGDSGCGGGGGGCGGCGGGD